MIFCLTSPKMCNVFKKGKNAQTLDKHLNVNTSIHCERVSNQFALKSNGTKIRVSMFSSCKKQFF